MTPLHDIDPNRPAAPRVTPGFEVEESVKRFCRDEKDDDGNVVGTVFGRCAVRLLTVRNSFGTVTTFKRSGRNVKDTRDGQPMIRWRAEEEIGRLLCSRDAGRRAVSALLS